MTKLYAPDLMTGKIRDAGDVMFAEKVFDSKRDKGVWPTIELMIDYWTQKNPTDWKAFKIHLENTRNDLKDRKFGQTPDKNMERRLTMVFPEKLHYMIRAIYKPDELKMDKGFYLEFLKRFPIFQVPEKI